MGDGKEREKTGRDFPYPRRRIEGRIEQQMSRFVESEPNRRAAKKLHHLNGLCVHRRRGTAEHQNGRGCPPARGTHVAPIVIEAQQLL